MQRAIEGLSLVQNGHRSDGEAEFGRAGICQGVGVAIRAIRKRGNPNKDPREKTEGLAKVPAKPKFIKNKFFIIFNHNLLPLLPPSLLVVSVGIGVTSSILPILKPDLARALMAA